MAAKTRGDLEHVLQTVLETFDSSVDKALRAAEFKNRNAAASFNRNLRMQLCREYKSYIAEQSADGGRPARERFVSIRDQCHAILASYLERSRGGALAWQHFLVLQDYLRMEQVDTREKLLRDELLGGQTLPDLSVAAKEAESLVRLLGPARVPAWVLALDEGHATP